MSFDNLGLEPRLMQAVAAMGYTEPTPIQSQAIPIVLAGNDIVGCAQTGTGKTAAFVLPTLQLIPARPGGPRALVVTPTRELALQILEVATAVSRHTRHRTAAVYGGVGYEPQRKAIRRGVDVLVATPGRLLDLVGQGDVDLSHVEILVLDEADRMLDQGFWPDVRRIIERIPTDRQTLLFSATMSPEVLKVIGDTLKHPERVDVSPPNKPIEAIEQSLYPVAGTQKNDLLLEMIRRHRLERVLVFTRTKHRADRVAHALDRAGIRSAAIHGNRSQSQRVKALDEFKRGHCKVLVATDIVARGIDVDGISHVINYDLPNVPEDYVHRIGRTARAGKSGFAFSLMSPEEHDQLRDIEKKIGAIINAEDLHGFVYSHDRMVPDPERPVVAIKAQGGGKPRPTAGSGQRSRRRGGNGRAGGQR
ncbi:MAG: DEAD/DEAH box helicase [Coriobacteriia bacterium]|nr:DEAD/DEAH box helicase [Coriobacteriia bacterium]